MSPQICSDAQQNIGVRLSARAALAALGCISALTVSTGCGRQTSNASARGDTVFVGVAVGLTAPERYVNVFEGVQMALDQLNAARPSGSPVLGMRRPPASAKSVVAVAAAFRDDPNVIGVVGHTESAATITAAAVYADRSNGERNAIAAVSPTAGAPAVTLSSEWVFRVCPTTTEQARALARYLADSLGVHRAGMLYRNEPSGIELLRVFSAEYASRGGVVTERDPFTEDIPEFDAYAKRIVKSNTPAAVIAGNTTEERPFARSLHAVGGTQLLLGTNPPEVSDSASLRDLRGMRFVQLYSPSHPATPEGAKFATAFLSRTGKIADRWGALGYDAAMLIGLAEHSEGPDRRKIRDWIATVGRSRPAYAGATGIVGFDEHRNPVTKKVRIAEANQ
jgi:branched-chain amino acid transport system substrate-binding protein